MIDRIRRANFWIPNVVILLVTGAGLMLGCSAQPTEILVEPTVTATANATAVNTPVPSTPQASTSAPSAVSPQLTSSPPPTQTPATPPETPGDVASDIRNFALESLTVPVGTTITWTNQDGTSHTSTSGTPQTRDGVWDSQVLRNSGTFSFTFSQAGEFPYFCAIHTSMRGTITVTR